MRLLLLFSALLAALIGVAGTNAAAQPVQASAAASVAAVGIVAASPVAARYAVPAYGWAPPLRLALPRLMSAAGSRRLYAERRRE